MKVFRLSDKSRYGLWGELVGKMRYGGTWHVQSGYIDSVILPKVPREDMSYIYRCTLCGLTYPYLMTRTQDCCCESYELVAKIEREYADEVFARLGESCDFKTWGDMCKHCYAHDSDGLKWETADGSVFTSEQLYRELTATGERVEVKLHVPVRTIIIDGVKYKLEKYDETV